MPKTLPNPGTYTARRNGPMVVYEADTGSLCVAVPVILVNSEVAWSGKHTIVLGKSDGTLQTKAIDNLGKTFTTWDRLDFFALEEIPLDENVEAEFEVVGEHSDFTNSDGETFLTFKIQWLNPLGGSANMPEKVDAGGRKILLAKWSSKFKAHSGGTAAKKTASPAQASTPVRSGPPSRGKTAAPAGQVRTLTQEEVWDLLQKNNPNYKGGVDALANDLFYPAQDKLFPGKNGDLTIQEWGQVASELGV